MMRNKEAFEILEDYKKCYPDVVFKLEYGCYPNINVFAYYREKYALLGLFSSDMNFNVSAFCKAVDEYYLKGNLYSEVLEDFGNCPGTFSYEAGTVRAFLARFIFRDFSSSYESELFFGVK